MTRWAILTGEYPPQTGGVSDYTRQVCRSLAAAGDHVTVFAPPCSAPELSDERVSVIRLRDHFLRAGRSEAMEQLLRLRPDRVLVQYVPHSFGMKAMNLPFAWWVGTLRRIAPVWVLFHEVAFPFVRRPLKHNLIAWVNRLMAGQIATAAERVFVTTRAWGELLHRIAPRSRPAEWLPVPSTLPTNVEPIRKPGETMIGHFGTYGSVIADLLLPALAAVLPASGERVVLLVGRGGVEFRERFIARHPDLAGRVTATGELTPTAVAAHLAGCDVLLQPFPDGVSGRRTSAICGLALGVPLLTNLGPLSESEWSAEANGVWLADTPAGLGLVAEQALTAPADERRVRGAVGREWYARRFALERTIAVLRGAHS